MEKKFDKAFADLPKNLQDAWVGWELGLAKGKSPEEVVHFSVQLGLIDPSEEWLYVEMIKSGIKRRGNYALMSASEADNILSGRTSSAAESSATLQIFALTFIQWVALGATVGGIFEAMRDGITDTSRLLKYGIPGIILLGILALLKGKGLLGSIGLSVVAMGYALIAALIFIHISGGYLESFVAVTVYTLAISVFWYFWDR